MRSRAILSLSAFVLLSAFPAKAQMAQAPKPGPETKKMTMFVGHFTNDGEAKAGIMGPNATKISSTEDCKWTAGGFAILCNETSEAGGMKSTSTSLMYYDPSDKMYHYHDVDSAGDVGESTGTFDGDTWTWSDKGFMGGKVMYSKFTMNGVSKDGYTWTMGAGDSESSIQEGMTGKVTRAAAAAKPMAPKTAAQ